MPTAIEIAEFADDLLRSKQIPDYPHAFNGLQVGTDAPITKLAAAVDFAARTVESAQNTGANLLLVHHGAFWQGTQPIVGARHRILSQLLRNSIGVYSSHIPLDCHPTLGNNPLLAKSLGLVPTEGFGRFNGIDIGVAGESPASLEDLVRAVGVFTSKHGGRPHVTPFAPEARIGRWAVCSGAGAGSETLREASERGIKTLIVGEGPHWTAVHAEDNQMVIIYAGHYATETPGVQALAAAISENFSIPWEFIEAPTGT